MYVPFKKKKSILRPTYIKLMKVSNRTYQEQPL